MADIRINALATTAASTASDDFIAVDGSANGTRKLNAYSPTFGGNLTVSGTGTNSITATKATGGQLPLIYTGDGSYSAWQIQNSNGFVLFGKESTSGGQLFSTATANAGVIAVSGANNFELSTNNTKRLTIDGSTGAATLAGNLTVSGTGTSNVGGTRVVGSSSAASGSGKLELATHTTSAGGIGFGTDTSWYRSQGGVLTLDTSANFQGFEAKKNGTLKFNFYSNSSDTFIGYKGTGSLTIQTLTGTTALTLDSSQNATFAGRVTLNTTGATKLDIDRTATTAGNWIRWLTASSQNWLLGSGISGNDTDMSFYSYGGGGTALSLSYADGKATFSNSIKTAAPSGGTAGEWKLGVRVAATTTLDTTQYLQVDIGGTLYKVALVTP